jgi:hypothetical protein
VADGVEGATAWPSALTVAASWDRDLMKQFASAMAVEQRIKGSNVMLGPMVNIARVPRGGEQPPAWGHHEARGRHRRVVTDEPLFLCIQGGILRALGRIRISRLRWPRYT